MHYKRRLRTRLLLLPFLAAALSVPALRANGPAPAAAQAPAFDATAAAALAAMQAKASELGIKGVAIVAYAPGDPITSWSSKMLVVGNMTRDPSGTRKGDNFLGIAYAKASEMASTLKNSGSGSRPVYTGEFGWQGGVVGKGKTGVLIAAFSGGKSEDDVAVSTAGLGVLSASL